MFNTELTLHLLQYMPIASIAGLMMLFWQYTNEQMFANKVDPIWYEDEVRLSHHFVANIEWRKLPEAHKALVYTILILIAIHGLYFVLQFYNYFYDPHQKLTLVEQNLPNYFRTL